MTIPVACSRMPLDCRLFASNTTVLRSAKRLCARYDVYGYDDDGFSYLFSARCLCSYSVRFKTWVYPQIAMVLCFRGLGR